MDDFHCRYLSIKCFHSTFFYVIITITLLMSSVEAEADSNSNMSWGEFPKAASGPPSLDYSEQGLGPYFALARSFVYTSLAGFPLDLYDMIGNKETNMVVIKETILKNIGFIVAVAVGILFIVIFSIVGSCFFCCRSCGKCGGRRIQKNGSNKRRKIYVLLLLINVILCATGMACMLTSLAHIGRNVKSVPKTIKTSVNYINYYVDELFTQVDFIGNKTETLLMDAIEKDLDNINSTVGVGLQTDINDETHIRSLFNDIRQFNNDMITIQSIIHDVNSTMESLESAVNTLKNSLSALKTDIDNNCNNCPSTKDMQTDFDTGNLPDVTNNTKEIDKLVDKGLDSMVDPLEKKFNDIPELVKNNSQGTIKEVKKVIKTFRTTIGDYRKSTNDLKNKINNSVNSMTDFRSLGLEQNYEGFKDEFNKFWLAVSIPLGFITVLIIFLQLIGLIFGTFGKGDRVKPTKRNSLSNCGGIFLMCSVGFMFWFGSSFMVLTTLTYIPGSIVERFGCSIIREIDTGSLDKIMPYIMPNKQFFGDVVPVKINVSISEVYRCKAGEALPKALETDIIIINTMTDFSNKLEIKDKINSVSVDLSNIEIMNSDVKTWFNDMDSGLDINFTKFKSELQKKSTRANFSQISSELNTAAKPNLATRTENIQKNEVNNVNVLKEQLMQNITLLQNKSDNIEMSFQRLKLKINASQSFLNNSVDGVVKKRLESFADSLLAIWNSFTSNILHLLNNMLPCKPAVDMFEFLSIGLVCGTVDALNGFWFGFGWFIFFFIPGIILSVKLAKYYRRMLYSDELDPSNSTMGYDGTSGHSETYELTNNKVGHM